MMPVATVARQSGRLDAEHAPDFPGANLTHQSLKSWSLYGSIPRAPKIIVDHDDVVKSEFPSAVTQAVLAALALLVVQNLAW
jgi:hypothetical protein